MPVVVFVTALVTLALEVFYTRLFAALFWKDTAFAILSLAMVETAHATPGTEVTLVWGEPGRGSSKPTVERHTQVEIRATVAPVPISEVARVAYRPK